MPDHSGTHSCEAKSNEILRRTGIATSHDEVSYLCEQLGFTEPGEFVAWMASLSDQQLIAEIQRLLEKRRKKLMGLQETLEIAYIA